MKHEHMEIGIFAKTFGGTLPDILRKVETCGLKRIQFNFSITGIPSMPDDVSLQIRNAVESGLQEQQLSVEAVSGTFNMIHPDPAVRRSGLKRLGVIAAQCEWLNTRLITLCTGSRNAEDMWTAHPDNSSRSAWYDLRESLDIALMHAEEYDLFLGIEPELSNVISSAGDAAKLLSEINSPRLKIIYDPANLIERETIPVMSRKIAQAVQLLGPHIVSVHAKDRNGMGEFVPAGKGILPYEYLLEQLKQVNYKGNLILHGLKPAEAAESISFLKEQLDLAGE